ncbi:DUF1254 domain-containing protein [Paraburkholderia sp. J12]|uniref:DUF1254 domain-containing protein n=1 Tax=Paraburkholderia sp. J12 TaxID=2805432 RepID=UPI002ABD8BD7|nr:DUF1254 domain-containing protein [Paraburkholderia sp. J12]
MYNQTMSIMEKMMGSDEDPRVALVRMAAGAVALSRYPVVESVRTCALHTLPHSRSPMRMPFNTIHASTRCWTHEDRDVVTPANDFLYLNGWVDLSNGPVQLDIPPVDGDRYFVIELLDAFTNNFVNLSARSIGRQGGHFVLHLEGEAPEPRAGKPVACPTRLVWLLGRVLVHGERDLEAARQVANAFRLSGEPVSGPASVSRWHESGDAALDFFQNVFNSLADFPVCEDEAPMFALLRRAGVKWHAQVDVATLPETVQEGLRLGYAVAHRLITAFTESRTGRSWVYSLGLGRYGHDHLLRACTAMKGLGALAADEAVYASADFDDTGAHLDGRNRYELYFPPGQLPPVDAMWSLSLYGMDRFFVGNPIRRYAIGDRTPGLQYDADGGLRLVIQHEIDRDSPQSTANWLPAPAGGFYLILRFYHPQAAFLEGRYAIPAIHAVQKNV